uniref:hypothetical protein n=1 Tax=Pseudomonas aeruginosa TaxID=287 RepID=UPI001CD44C11
MSKELNKAPVEQAGEDERVIGWRERILAAHPNSDPGFWPDALLVEHMAEEIADLRAALAQPSPALELERPEVVARVVHSNPVVLGQCGPLNANDELMTVAQHAASVARWAEMFNRVEQERDSALAEVERLRESKGDPSGSFDRCMKMMYERDENAKRLDAALAKCAELKAELAMANDAAAKGDAARHQCAGMEMEIKELRGAADHWEAESRALQKLRDAALARVEELDKQCRDDVARALGLRPSQDRGFAWSYLLASIKSCVKASEDAAQAQHSVPEGWRIERSAERIVVMNMKNGAGYAAARDGESGIAESVLYLLAADL